VPVNGFVVNDTVSNTLETFVAKSDTDVSKNAGLRTGVASTP